MQRLHKALAGIVDQNGAMPAQGLGRQWRWVEADIQRGRVKLNEFHIGQSGPGACRHADTATAGFCRIGGAGIEVSDAAGSHHHGAGLQTDLVGAGARLITGHDANHLLALGENVLNHIAIENPDGRRLFHRGDQGFHDRLAGHIAAHADNAFFRMSGLARHPQLAFQVTIKRHAELQQIGYPVRRLGGHQAGDFFIHNAGTGFHRVGDVLFDRVPFGDGCGNTRLGPGRRGPTPQRCCGQHGDRPRRQFEGTEEPGQATANDDHIIGAGGADGTQKGKLFSHVVLDLAI